MLEVWSFSGAWMLELGASHAASPSRACVTGGPAIFKDETQGFGNIHSGVCSVFGQPAPVADRVSKQNALFEEFYQTGLKNSPERATSLGDYRYMRSWDSP